MSDRNRDIGRCPDCNKPITRPWVLVEYEKDDGTDGVWAECPACAEVIAPE